jgi:hypothetical protein
MLFQFRIVHTKKTNANRYMPGMFDLTQDLCELTAENSKNIVFFKSLADKIYQSLNKIINIFKQCPVEVSFSKFSASFDDET